MSKKVLRVDLKGDYQIKFEKIKEKNRYNTDAETIRGLLDYFQPGTNQVKIPVELIEKIEKELRISRTRTKYGIFKIEDFISRAVISYLEKIREERGSLLEWQVRSELTDSQREIAIAFFELQSKNPTGLTKSMIADYLEKPEKALNEDLELLVNVKLLERHGRFFYAP